MSERVSNPRAGCFFFLDFATLAVALTLLPEEGLGASSVFVLEDRRTYFGFGCTFSSSIGSWVAKFSNEGIALLVHLDLHCELLVIVQTAKSFRRCPLEQEHRPKLIVVL
ncbi:hypothetical protein Tco_0960696 [Tanacetum coccineum]